MRNSRSDVKQSVHARRASEIWASVERCWLMWISRNIVLRNRWPGPFRCSPTRADRLSLAEIQQRAIWPNKLNTRSWRWKIPRLLTPDLPSHWDSWTEEKFIHSNCKALDALYCSFLSLPLCVRTVQFARLVPSLEVVAVSQVPSPESNPDSLLPVTVMVGQYTTIESGQVRAGEDDCSFRNSPAHLFPESSQHWLSLLFWLLALFLFLKFCSKVPRFHCLIKYDVLLLPSIWKSFVVRCFEHSLLHTEPTQFEVKLNPVILTCINPPWPFLSVFYFTWGW